MSKFYKAEEVISFLNTYCPKDMWEYQIADLPTIEVSEDCISRADTIKSMERIREDVFDGSKPQIMPITIIEWAIEDIKNAPSVVPSRAEGEWYRQTTDHFDYWECSECGMGVGLDDIKNYCPNCGAKMKGPDDE